jgi:hypothetical protein
MPRLKGLSRGAALAATKGGIDAFKTLVSGSTK